MSFKVGDLVKMIGDYDGLRCTGLTAKVVRITSERIGLDFNNVAGTSFRTTHSLNGFLKDNTGWWVRLNVAERYMEKVNRQLEFEF